MYIHPTPAPVDTPIPGVAHATWAGQDQGLSQLSLWRQRLAPGSATPPHRHDCDELVLCQAGRGTLLIDGERLAFQAGQVLTLPGGGLHQIVNEGAEPLEMLAAFAATPVATYLPGDEPLALPWRT
jgi:gentisate 1,2-dioxygenase